MAVGQTPCAQAVQIPLISDQTNICRDVNSHGFWLVSVDPRPYILYGWYISYSTVGCYPPASSINQLVKHWLAIIT